MKKTCILMAMLAVLALSAVSTAQAATIVWGDAQNITDDSDVSLEGTLVRADRMKSPDTTVNGVVFADSLTMVAGVGHTSAIDTFIGYAQSLLSRC